MADTETTTEFKIGDLVKLPNGEETFRVKSIHENGDVTAWGGSKNPNAFRSMRSFYPGVLVPETRKQIIKSWES